MKAAIPIVVSLLANSCIALLPGDLLEVIGTANGNVQVASVTVNGVPASMASNCTVPTAIC